MVGVLTSIARHANITPALLFVQHPLDDTSLFLAFRGELDKLYAKKSNAGPRSVHSLLALTDTTFDYIISTLSVLF